MMKARQLGAFLLIGLIWGSEWIPRQAIDAPPLRALAMRYAMAAIILACATAFRPARLPGWRALPAAAMVGIALLTLPPVLTLWAAQQISPGLLVAILSLTPLLAALLEGQVGGWLAPLVGGVGGTALLLSSGLSFHSEQWAGVLATLASALLIAQAYVYAKRRLSELRPVAMAAIQFAAGFAALACASLAIEGRSDWLWTRQTLLCEAILGLFGNALALPLYYYLLRRFESFQLTSTQWVVTTVSVAEGFVALRQRPSWEMLAGFALIAASVWSLLARRSEDGEPLTIRVTRPPFAG
jgi:drug/metabolite transporter (DMT)-like permease